MICCFSVWRGINKSRLIFTKVELHKMDFRLTWSLDDAQRFAFRLPLSTSDIADELTPWVRDKAQTFPNQWSTRSRHRGYAPVHAYLSTGKNTAGDDWKKTSAIPVGTRTCAERPEPIRLSFYTSTLRKIMVCPTDRFGVARRRRFYVRTQTAPASFSSCYVFGYWCSSGIFRFRTKPGPVLWCWRLSS
jgi:hypothetical protein